jgi:hypothetical protein
MKIEIEMGPKHLEAFTAYSQLTGIPIENLVTEALTDYSDITLAARLESIVDNPSILSTHIDARK